MSLVERAVSIGKDVAGVLKKAFNPQAKEDQPVISDDPDKIPAELDSLFQEEVNNRSGYEKMWFINIAAVLGHQYIQWNDYTRKFEEPKVPDWRVRLVVNKILPIYRKTLSKIMAYNPRFVVTPNSNEENDIESATLGTKIITGVNEKLKIKTLKNVRSQWKLLCGSVFTYFYWDSKKGKELPSPETSMETATVNQSNTLFEGDLGYEVIPAFEIFPLDNATSLSSCRRLMWVKAVSIEELKNRYPEYADELHPEKDDATVGVFEKKIQQLISTSPSYGSTHKKADDIILWKRVWERATERHPKGRYIVYANNVLLENKEIPDFKLGKEFEIPLLQYDDLSVVGRFWGQATIEQMLPLNKELNKTRSQIIESRNLMGKPKWTATKGSVDANAITDEPGEVIEWNTSIPGATKPTMETPVPLPNYIISLVDMLDKDIADIGRLHDVSFAQTPSGVKSGRAIRYLQEADDSELGVVLIAMSENDKILYSAFLKLIQEYYIEERLLKISGENNLTDVISFVGADLNDNTDVIIEEGDILPMSRAGRQEFILELYEKGLLGNPADNETRKRGMRMLQFGNVDTIYEESNLDNKQAKAENKEMMAGNIVVPNTYDLHVAHIIEHLKIMKSPLFKKKPEEIKAIFLSHLESHQDWLMPPEQAQPEEIPVQAERTQ